MHTINIFTCIGILFQYLHGTQPSHGAGTDRTKCMHDCLVCLKWGSLSVGIFIGKQGFKTKVSNHFTMTLIMSDEIDLRENKVVGPYLRALDFTKLPYFTLLTL